MTSWIPLENTSEVERVYGKCSAPTENNKPKESLIEWAMKRKKLEKYCDGYGGNNPMMKKIIDIFRSTNAYPKDYLGIAKKMAICKAPHSDLMEWWNAERCLSVENPQVGDIVCVTTMREGLVHRADWIFMGWGDVACYEWILTNGNAMTLMQPIVDDLLPEDMEYLMRC
jgi:hypothetical protein